MRLLPCFPLRVSLSLAVVLALGVSCSRQFSAAEADTSPLWGEKGEKWSPQGRLTDWSFAGYRMGDAPIPTPPVRANVKDFGAVGDGQTDDSAAFQRAIAATENGAILIPSGHYKLSDILNIRKSNIVLRGEGPDKTVLQFVKSLDDIKPLPQATTEGRPTSGYSWSGGLIRVEGKGQGVQLGLVKSRAARGEHLIELEKEADVKVGQMVEIRQQDAGDKSLLEHLYTGQPGDVGHIKGARTSFVSRVMVVQGAQITLERPLRTDIDPKWGAKMWTFAPSVKEVGIEDLKFEFPNTPYGGHFTEVGFNPLTFVGVSDCWARNITIFNADSGPFGGGNYVTVQNIVFDGDRTPDKSGNRGHHGFTMGDDTLLCDFDFRIKFVHDISAEMRAGSVASHGKGVDLCFDNHRRYPHANLYTDIDIGKGTRMYNSGGGRGLGMHSGAWSTWWNIRAARPQKTPWESYGPDSLNFVGITSDQPAVLEPNGRWFEPLSAQAIQPANLYEAQLRLRFIRKILEKPLE